MGHNRIKAGRVPAGPPLTFSFRHLDLNHRKFNLDCCIDKARLWSELFLRLSEFSAWTVDLFRDMNNQENRHSIYFDLTTEPNGFRLDDNDLGLEEAWQFCICKGELWRAHGVLLPGQALLYLVWIDPCHRLYQIPGTC